MLKHTILAFALLSAAPIRAEEKECPSPSKYDVGYFEDVVSLDHAMKNAVDPKLPKHKQQFCKGMPRNVKDRIPYWKDDRSGWNFNDTLAFENPPGPINAGMCWLHTRLQRQFTYLANYRPELPKPTKEQAKKIISDIVARKGVTEIPGFANLAEFSREYKAELVSAIDRMGWACVVKPTDCPARFADTYSPSPADVQATMDSLYRKQLLQHGDIQVIRTRMKKSSGITKPFEAHSMMILEMEPIRLPKEKMELMGQVIGYRLRVIDPNFQNRIEVVDYKFGDTSLNAGFIDVIPYKHYEYEGDIGEMNRSLDGYCKP